MNIAFMLIKIVIAMSVYSYSGYAAYYSPNVMERVADNRGMAIESCMVASPYEPLGRRVLVKTSKGTASCVVTDIAAKKDRASIIRRGIVIELDYKTAKRLCIIDEPPKSCRATIVLFSSQNKAK